MRGDRESGAHSGPRSPHKYNNDLHIIPTYLILADVFLSPWEQCKAVLPHVLGRVVDRDRVLRRENFVADVEVLGCTCPLRSEKHKRGIGGRSGVVEGNTCWEAIAGRCGDRVRWAHEEVRRGGRGLGGGLGVCDRRTRTRDRRERHG